jgi:hypothetical protein
MKRGGDYRHLFFYVPISKKPFLFLRIFFVVVSHLSNLGKITQNDI